MPIIWTENADSRQNLGPSGIVQLNSAAFAASDYVTGGYPIAPAAFGLGRITGLFVAGQTGTTEGYIWAYDTSTNPGQLKALTAAGTQTAAGTNFAAGTLTLMAYGY